MVRALYLDVPPEVLDERRRLGIDGRDEVWDGVIHMVPPPSMEHGRLQAKLAHVLLPIAERRGLCLATGSGLYQAAKNYRVPDITIGREPQMSSRGWEAAELVIEVLSPDDESRDKLSFFAKLGVREVWYVEPVTRAIELLVLRGRDYRAVAVASGAVRSLVLDIEISTVDGPRLRIRDGGDVVDV
jgi:Uma2 family endonuclease